MKSIICLLGIFFLTLVGAFSASIPSLEGRVNDYANLLSSEEKANLNSKLESYENQTSNQFVLLTINSLEGDSIEDFTNKVFKSWKLGQSDKNNGVLVVFSKGERKLRIEVGYGLEGAIPDGIASQILRNDIAVLTKQNKFYEGFSAGFDALIRASLGEYKIKKTETNTNYFDLLPTTEQFVWGVVAFVLILIFTIFCDDSKPYGLLTSLATGIVYGIFLYGSVGAVAICAVLSFVAFWIISILKSGDYSSGGGGYYSSSSSGGSGWSSSFGGSDWSSGGGSDSGFSGGGGDSGGGGASGDG